MKQQKLFDNTDNEQEFFENAFDWALEFPKLCDEFGNFEGFDVVLGNPPYIPLKKLPELKLVKDNYKTYNSNGDIYMLFIERALQIVKKNGLVNFIISNKWMRSAFGENLRSFLLENTKILKLIDFDSLKVFDKATVDTNIIEIKNQKNDSKSFETVRLDKSFNLEKDSIFKYFDENKKTLSNLTSEAWNLISEKEKLIKIKIEKIGKPIIEWNIKINSGIKTGLNEAFIINTIEKEKIICKEDKNKNIIKPLLQGKNIRKYYCKWTDLWLINSHNGLQSKKIKPINVEKEYPIIFKHLSKCLPKIKERFDKGKHWSNLRNCAYHNDFENEKIVWRAITKKFNFHYDTKSMYSDGTTFIMTGKDLKYILSILNSRLFSFCMDEIYLLGDTFRSKNKILQNFPIPEINEKNRKTVNKIKRLVNKILSTKEKNNKTDTSKEQTKIDNFIYKLYELTDTEIQLVTQ